MINRRNSVHAILILLLTIATGGCKPDNQPAAPLDSSSAWELVWQDEFEGAVLDSSKWDIQIGDGCDLGICGWGNNELQWYQADNILIDNGHLIITAREEQVNDKPYTSARLRTINKGDWTYGRVEARAKLPEGQGFWPAIWMLPTDNVYGGWAASGEIDIMELKGHKPEETHGTLHYGGSWPGNIYTGIEYTLPEGTFADDFHVFALEWEEFEMRWYVDDVHWQTQTEWSSEGQAFPAPFDQPFHLVLNLAVGGHFPGNPDETTLFPQRMELDYVRVYEQTSLTTH